MLIHRTRDLTLAVLENSRATGERLSTLALSRHWRSAVACAAEREVQVGRGYWRGRIARARRAQLGAQGRAYLPPRWLKDRRAAQSGLPARTLMPLTTEGLTVTE